MSPYKRSIPYNPSSKEPFRLSRAKIEDFIRCPRCFYLDRKLGIPRPPSLPFTLNNAVDELLKREFDAYRQKQEPHPIMQKYNIDAVPYKHISMDLWRDALRGGLRFTHEPTNFVITGGIDDVWFSRATNELHVVDYKAMSSQKEISFDSPWYTGYKRQIEIYQWLFRKNGFPVSTTGYFVACNADISRTSFEGTLHFSCSIITHEGADEWIEPTLLRIKELFDSNIVPDAAADCEFCAYRQAASGM